MGFRLCAEVYRYASNQEFHWPTICHSATVAITGLDRGIIMEKKTLKKEGNTAIEYRYFISSLRADIEQVSRAVRGHWSIESMHWYLDVTFREDANTTIDKLAAQNLNIIRKWSLSILKPAQITRHKLSMRKKRFVLSLRPIQYLEELLEA